VKSKRFFGGNGEEKIIGKVRKPGTDSAYGFFCYFREYDRQVAWAIFTAQADKCMP